MTAQLSATWASHRYQASLSASTRIAPWQDCYNGPRHQTIQFGALGVAFWFQRYKDADSLAKGGE